ncbi:unnamed protein product, partial [Meganyctiphanes norvegica]
RSRANPAVGIVEPSSVGSDKVEKREFMAVFPDLVRDLTEIGSSSKADPGIASAQKWYAKVLQYNVVGGKMTRGLAVPASFKLLATKEQNTPENIKKAYILGWCIELLQSFFLVADDIIDGSKMRRGKPAWYCAENVGLSAINDALLLENGIYKLLKKHFKDEPYYVDILELFHETTLKTTIGQCLDTKSSGPDGRPHLEKFTISHYNAISKHKTAYYSFYLPVALAMNMVGIKNTNNIRVAEITDAELHRQAKTILIEMGQFYQVQDDYLDCFGDLSVMGKSGTDIAEGKCTWLAVVALQRATGKQLELMKEYYGRSDPESVAKIVNLYKDLGLPATYRNYEKSTVNTIRMHIHQISRGLNHNVFFNFLNIINKRSQ